MPSGTLKNHSITESIGNFDRYTQWRMDMLYKELRGPQKVALKLLPFLLNEDLDRIGSERVYTTIYGVSGYEIDAKTKELVGQHFPIFNHAEANRRKRPIQFVAIMGSAGSLAFTAESDLDFWVGLHVKQFDPADLRSFQRKLESIEHWFWEFANLETHFFVTDIEKLRKEDYGNVNSESCGSAMGKILKEEYYRTSLLLVGKRPFYPVLPLNLTEREYNEEMERMLQFKHIPSDEFIDLGHLAMTGVDEFVGALLWQIVKGLKNPFKSVIKISLLKSYFYGATLCADEILRAVSFGHFPDPYFYVVRKVRDFEESRGQLETARLIEVCFLLKSLSGVDFDSRRGQTLVEHAAEWGYTSVDCQRFSDLRFWEKEEREELKKELLKFFLDSYKEIRESSFGNRRNSISPEDMTVLAKILKARLEQRPGKIPWLFYLLGPKLFDVMEFRWDREKEFWTCSIHLMNHKEESREVLFKHRSFPIALATILYNERIHRQLNLSFDQSELLTYGDGMDLLHQLEFLKDDSSGEKYDTFWKEATHVERLFFIPNWEFPNQKYNIQTLIVIGSNSIGEWEWKEYREGFQIRQVVKDWFIDRVGTKYLKKLKIKTFTVRGGVRRPKRLADDFQEKLLELQRHLVESTAR